MCLFLLACAIDRDRAAFVPPLLEECREWGKSYTRGEIKRSSG
jgi:hypothetical protein